MIAEVGIWKSAALDSRKKGSAVAFHEKRPISPHWTGGLDAICNVQKYVNCEGAGWEPFGVKAIIESVMKNGHVSKDTT